MNIKVCGDWWAGRLLPVYVEKRDAFARAVVAGIDRFIEQYPNYNVLRIKVDYDPDQLLLDALREAGIPCRGFLCSADRVFDDCWKTEMKIDLRAETVKVSSWRSTGVSWVQIGGVAEELGSAGGPTSV